MSDQQRATSADRPADRAKNSTSSWAQIQARFAVTGDDSSAVPTDRPDSPQPNNHRGTLSVRRLKSLVSDRDLAVLITIRDHRLISSQHLFRLHFWNHASAGSGVRACNRILNRLEQYRLIRRLPRPMGGPGGGSAATIWAVDVAGDRLLRDHLKLGLGRSRPFAPSLRFQDHTLAVADVRLALEEASRGGRFELLSVTCEPDNWRAFPGELGRELALKPDLAVVTGSGDYEEHWFLEVDRGTESGTALLRKCQTYLAYFRSGLEQRRVGVFPRVLWLMPDAERVALLTRLLENVDLAEEIFTIRIQTDLLGAVAS